MNKSRNGSFDKNQAAAINKQNSLAQELLDKGLGELIAADYRKGILRLDIARKYGLSEDDFIAKGAISFVIRKIIPTMERYRLEKNHRQNNGRTILRQKKGMYNKERTIERLVDYGYTPWISSNGVPSERYVALEMAEDPRFRTKNG